jgi:hypothetical protein
MVINAHGRLRFVHYILYSRYYCFKVLFVKRVNSDILLERIRKNPNATRPASTTKDNIIRRLGGDEDDVQMDSCKISLVDPVGLSLYSYYYMSYSARSNAY